MYNRHWLNKDNHRSSASGIFIKYEALLNSKFKGEEITGKMPNGISSFVLSKILIKHEALFNSKIKSEDITVKDVLPFFTEQCH